MKFLHEVQLYLGMIKSGFGRVKVSHKLTGLEKIAELWRRMVVDVAEIKDDYFETQALVN